MERLSLVARLALRNMFRNPKRSFLTVSAVVIGVGGFVALAALARGMSRNLVERAIADLTGHIQIHAPGYLDDPSVERSMSLSQGDVERVLSEEPEVAAFASRIRLPGVILSERNSRGVTFVGITPKSEEGLSFIGGGVAGGRMLRSAEEEGIVIGEKLARDLETTVGKRVVLMAHSSNGEIRERGFRVIGMFRAPLQAVEERFVFLGFRVAESLVGLEGRICEVSLKLGDESRLAENFPALRARLLERFPGTEVKLWSEIQAMASAMLEIQDGFLFLWLFIVVVTIVFGVVNTLFMAIFDRMREIGLLQALGMGPGLISAEVLCESFALLIVGALGGTGLGMSIASAFSGGIDLSAFAEGLGMAGFGTVVYPVVRIDDLVRANVFAIVLGMLASAYPAFYASRLQPICALRSV